MTFFDREGNLDERATIDHWHWLVSQGVHGLVVAGTSGEFIALTLAERERLFQLAVEQFGGRLPIVAGSGHASTRHTIELSRRAQELGVDALIVILPYFSRPPVGSLLDHYRSLRRAVDRPIMLYNNPANSAAVALTPPQIAALVEEDVVHMVKSTMESVVPVHDLAVLVGDRMRIFYGSFLCPFEALAAGAHGWISGVLNVVAPEALAMHQALVVERRLADGWEQWKRILPIVHLYTYQKLGPAADIPIYRAILELWGRHGGYSRQPFDPLSGEQIARLKTELAAVDWLSR